MTKGLRHLPLPHRTVEVAEGASFTVRGFSPDDALAIYHRHTGELSRLFDEFAGVAKGKAKVEVDEIKAFTNSVGMNMVHGAPRVIAEIIAVAAGGNPQDEDEFNQDVSVALKLPAGAQLDALQKIGELTFTSEMPPGKFLAVVVKLAGGTAAALTPALPA